MSNSLIIRQGDVLLQPVASIAPSFEGAPLDADGSATIAHGKATGHRHRLEFIAGDDGSALSSVYVHPIARAEVARVSLKQPQVLLHEEHTAHEVLAGTWRVSRPFEYQGAELPRMVAD